MLDEMQFCPTHAKVNAFNLKGTIDEIFLISIVYKNEDGWLRCATSLKEGKFLWFNKKYKQAYLYLKDSYLPLRFIDEFYEAIWYKYFKLNPDLVTLLSQHGRPVYTGPRTTSQADYPRVLNKVATQGIDSLYPSDTFIKLLQRKTTFIPKGIIMKSILVDPTIHVVADWNEDITGPVINLCKTVLHNKPVYSLVASDKDTLFKHKDLIRILAARHNYKIGLEETGSDGYFLLKINNT